MAEFIDLDRRFRALTNEELDEPDHLAALIDFGLGEGETWPEVLRHPRTVILAEAGAGKTDELRQQARRLTVEGAFAIFVPLEGLGVAPLCDLLDVEEEQRLATWHDDGEAIGFFFLDAVDELKLTDGKLDGALLRLAKAIHGHLNRACIVLSCRPSDWRKVSDREVLERRLAYSTPEVVRQESSAEEFFLQALRREEGAGEERDEISDRPTEPVRVLVMLPMSEHQIRKFAALSGVRDLEAFLSELERRNAWTFARRPLDLADLVQLWIEAGHLGTRAEQHDANVRSKLMDNPDRGDANVLSDAKAREGAERLALALVLTKTRTIRAPGQDLPHERAAGVLDSAAVLPDWSAGERNALLRRALFDPATHGRVRFHHRSVQEYLAGRRLSHLRDAGMSMKALLRLVFATKYGIEVVIPSMRAVVAWLALWIDDVRREAMRREPEVLFTFGDPETLPIEARVQLLTRLVEAYGRGSWRGLEVPLDEVRRLAHPELGPTIRRLWGHGPENEEIRGTLLRLIWQGRIESCADIAEALAVDILQRDVDRILAIRALVATERKDCLRALADDMVARPEAWPDRVVFSAAEELFPDFLSLDALMQLIDRTPEPRNTVGGFAWATRMIADELDPSSELSIGFRDRIAELIFRNRDADLNAYDIHGSFDYLAPAVAKLCLAQLSRLDGEPDIALIWAAAIASRFGQGEVGWREPVSDLRAFFQADGREHRAHAFWAEVDLMDLLAPTEDSWERLFNAEHDALIGSLVDTDRLWLETALLDTGRPERQAPALHALVNLWQSRGRSPEELEALASEVREDPELSEALDARTRPKPPDPDRTRRELEAARLKEERTAQEQERLSNWQDWRIDLLAEPDEAFLPDRRTSLVDNVYTWLRAGGQRNRWNVWDGERVAAAFGSALKDRIQEAFQEHWRSVTPVPWSRRPREERNSTPFSWTAGLCGISAESESPGWAARLTPDEARLAALYSMIELNGFASFLPDLAEAHPDDVEDVIGEELSAELQQGTHESHLPTLQDLGHADPLLKRLMVPRLLAELGRWPEAVTSEEEFQLAQHLDRVLRLLAEGSEGEDRENVARVCQERLMRTPPDGALQITWLKGLIRVDAAAATSKLVEFLGRADEPEARSRGVAIFSKLFGEHGGATIEIVDPGLRAQVLGQLIRAAYAFVRREEDVEHEGTYTPDYRDDAQSARGRLLAQLVETPGDEARRVLLDLAEEPEFQHFPDRLRLLARQRAATDAEPPPYSAEAVCDLDRRYEVPPSERDGLFAVVLDRFEDIAHDIRDSDFTDRRTLRTISDETEMQRTLAGRLEAKANGAYVVVREEEVADHKLPDIRLAATRGDQRVAAEVKIADNDWSVADLEHALEHQVLGQYLRHDRCRAGCLVLTYAGPKRWNSPAGGGRIDFPQLVAHLNVKAQELEETANGKVRLVVVGIDLTDPELAPAHR